MKYGRRRTDDDKNLDTLRKLTEKLNFSRLVIDKGDGFINISLKDNKKAPSINLLHIPELAIAKTYIPKDSEFPKHAHAEWELILIYKGDMTLIFDDEEKRLEEGDFYYIEPNVTHGAKCVKETIMIGMTIPASQHWPKN